MQNKRWRRCKRRGAGTGVLASPVSHRAGRVPFSLLLASSFFFFSLLHF